MESIATNLNSYHTEILENKNLPEKFWNLALKEFIEEKDYLKRITFFMRHNLKYDLVYEPVVYHSYHSSDIHNIYSFFDQELKAQGFDPRPLKLEDLIKWYYDNVDTLQDSSKMNIWEMKNYYVFQRRFTLNVFPTKSNVTNVSLFNFVLEQQIRKEHPEILFENLIQDFENTEVYDKRIQIEAMIKTIQENIEAIKRIKPESQDDLNLIERLDGYNDLRIGGKDCVPSDKKIIKDYVYGKNLAVFEIHLLKLLKEFDAPLTKDFNTNKLSKGYKILYLLMNEFNMFSSEKYSNLTAVKKAKLLGMIFNLESEGIRQDLSKVNNFINEGNNRAELTKMIDEINMAKQVKRKKS